MSLFNAPLKRYSLPYVRVPSALEGLPALVSPVTLVSGSEHLSGYIQNIDIGTVNNNRGKDVNVQGTWANGFIVRGLQGQRGIPIRFINDPTVGAILGSTSLGQDTVQQVNQATNCEFHGYDIDHPWSILVGSGAGGYSGFNWGSSPAGTSIHICNAYVKDASYAGIITNFGTGTNVGHGWNGDSYEEVCLRFFRVDGLVSEGEGGYFGHTSSTFAELRRVVLLHFSAMNKGREGFQTEHCDRVLVYNGTSRNVGQNTGGLLEQENLVQVHDCGTAGNQVIIENYIFDGAPNLWNLFTHNLVFRNCYFRWTNGMAGYIGQTDTSYFAGSPRLTGAAVTFDSCYFVGDNGGSTISYMTQLAELNCNFTWVSCHFTPNISAIWQDQRVGSPVNVIAGTIGSNGNVYDSNIPIPTYASDNVLDFHNYNLVTNTWFHAKGMGSRTPAQGKLNICQSPYNPTIKVAYGSDFSSVVTPLLPTTQPFLLQDGHYRTLPVTWNVGSYNPTTAGDYTIQGSPALPLPSDVRNTAGVVGYNVVTVKPAPAPTKIVVVNFADPAGPPITDLDYNNIFIPTSGNTNGTQTVYGDGNTAPFILASLINTEGTLTGYQIAFPSSNQFSGGSTGRLPSPTGTGIYPDDAIVHLMYNPAGSGYRTFTIAGLDNTLTYTIKIMSSGDTYLSSPQTCNQQVTGSGGTTTVSAFNEYGNQSNVSTFTAIPVSGVITIGIGIASGRAAISVLQIEYTP